MWLVVIASEPDADHLIASVSRSAERGQEILICIIGPSSETLRNRLDLVKNYRNVKVIHLTRYRTRHTTLGRLLRVQHRLTKLRTFLTKYHVEIVLQEWGDGVAFTSGGIVQRLRKRYFAAFPLQIQMAAHSLAIPVVALPHGHAMKMTSIGSLHAFEVARQNSGKLPFKSRESFSAYVVAHQSDKDFLIQRSDMSGKNVEVWGSARFSPQWIEKLYESCKPFVGDSKGQLNVLFFLPKWNNFIDRAKTLDLLTALGRLNHVELWIREHPRKNESSLSDDEWFRLCILPAVRRVDSTVDSVRLIKGCHLLIEIESSIAIDAVMLGKPVIMPRYLQDQSVISRLDSSESILRTGNCEETVRAVTPDLKLPTYSQTFLENVAAQRSSDTTEFYDRRLISLARKTTDKNLMA